MAKTRMKQAVIPQFSSEAEEAAWWETHRREIEAETRQRMKQKRPLKLGSLFRGARPSQPVNLRGTTPDVTNVSLASSKSASDNGSGRITASQRNPMAVAKLKPPKTDRLEELAERLATEINERAARMTPEERAKADSETKKIAAQVQRRTP